MRLKARSPASPFARENISGRHVRRTREPVKAYLSNGRKDLVFGTISSHNEEKSARRVEILRS
jgi:hypothetical protein